MTTVAREVLRPAAVPGDALLHPMMLAALVLLIVNDHVLKSTIPGGLTGILSGIAGVALLPAVLVGGSEVIAAARGRWHGPDAHTLTLACVATGAGYAAVELVPAAADTYRFGLGVLQWPAASVVALAAGSDIPPVVPVRAVADPLDLAALIALAVPWWIGSRR